jgi:monoamine oxidase
MKKEKILIVGAGLSGLYSAVLLQDRYDVEVLEARERTGGRILAMGGHDMGPSWVWGHQKNILQLIRALGLELFPQYTQGLSVYDAPQGVQQFKAPEGALSYRIKGGVSQLIAALEKRLHAPLRLNEKVVSLSQTEEKISVKTVSSSFKADKVIITLPPRLALESIAYSPALPSSLASQLQHIPTWMGYAAKCVVEYSEAFWREEGLSGFGVSHLGPLGEIHDACTQHKAALFGFVHSTATFDEAVIAQLTRLYGKKAANPLAVYMADWKKEQFTSTLLDRMPLREHPSYGFEATHMEGKVLFAGTESALSDGGYLEGAVLSAMKLAKSL